MWTVRCFAGLRRSAARSFFAARTGPGLPVAIAALCWLTWFGSAAGQIQSLPRTPAGPGYSKQSGLQVSVDYPRPTDLGYVSMRFTMRRQNPGAPSQLITIRTRLMAQHHGVSQAIEVEQDFEMEANKAVDAFIIRYPCYANYNRVGWTIWVDGRRDQEISTFANPTQQPGSVEMTSVLQSFEAKDNSRLQYALGDSFGGGAQELAIAWQDWPIHWLDYTTIDLATIDAAELIQLADERPAAHRALLRWIRAGGNLWIVGLGRQWEQLDAVEQKLALPDRSDQVNDLPVSHGWQVVSLGDRARQAVESLLEISEIKKAIAVTEESDDATENASDAMLERTPGETVYGDRRSRGPRRSRGNRGAGALGRQVDAVPKLTTSADQFYVRTYGLGTLTVQTPQTDESVFAISQFNQAFSESLLTRRMNWAIRHGLDPSFPSREFNNWLIPGVGVAPVGGFQLLLSLFVIGIGPLNYWLLRRAKKLPWLLITVPGAAASVTLLLFAYGILADGFDVQVRARSVTLLDQGAGEAATWARLSYYAGLAPPEGLTFSDRVAIFPVRPSSSAFDSGAGGEQRELLWEERTQRLTRGWLFSRTPAQYLTISTRPLSARLDIERTASGLQATNRLGVHILALAVQDDSGNHYWIEELADGGTTTLAAAEYSAVARDLRELFSEHEPVFPPGAQPDGASYNVTLEYNLLEGQLGAVASPLARGLGNSNYVAITRRGIDLELGRDDIGESDSFHVIKGRYALPAEDHLP